VRVRIGHDHLHVEADRPTAISVGGIAATADTAGLGFRRIGETWELLT
jgi:hypothetical protein